MNHGPLTAQTERKTIPAPDPYPRPGADGFRPRAQQARTQGHDQRRDGREPGSRRAGRFRPAHRRDRPQRRRARPSRSRLRRRSAHHRRKERPIRRNRFRLLLPGLSRSRLPHPRRDGRNRAPVIRKLPLEANKSHRSPGLATGRAKPEPRRARSRRADHRQPQRRRLPHRERRRNVGRSPARASRSRRGRRQKHCQRSPGSGPGPG